MGTRRTVAVPAGTRITLALVDPIWAKAVKAGDPVYAVTAFPVASNGVMVVPTGTYLLGQIDAVTKSGFFSPHAPGLAWRRKSRPQPNNRRQIHNKRARDNKFPPAQPDTPQPDPTITVPEGTRIQLALANPISRRNARVGGSVRAVTTFRNPFPVQQVTRRIQKARRATCGEELVKTNRAEKLQLRPSPMCAKESARKVSVRNVRRGK